MNSFGSIFRVTIWGESHGASVGVSIDGVPAGIALSVDDFVKKTQYTYFTRDALSRVAEDVAYFATKEGLTAHANSIHVRFE